MNYKIEVGDFVRSFHPREESFFLPGKLYPVVEVVKSFSTARRITIHVENEQGGLSTCIIGDRDAYLEVGQEWEILSYSTNLKTILE